MGQDAKALKPLAGIKVVELAHVMAGPVCGLMLADLGADVIKVERAPHGDSSREDDAYTIDGEAASFMMVNRNKRGIAVDLKSDGGRRVLERLLEGADVLLENYRRDTIEKLGFGYSSLKDRYPRLIYCAISGFGRSGPYADRAGFDLIAQGMSSLMSFTGERVGRPPMKCGAPVTDIVAGILAALGTVSALHQRAATGRGQMVDTSLLEAGIVLSYWQSAIFLAGGGVSGPMGSAHPLNAPYQAFEAADGWLTLGAANQSNWLRLVEAMEVPELAVDPRFVSNALRLQNRAALEATLNPVFRTRTRDEWMERLRAAGVPAGPILNVEEMLQDQQVLARKMCVSVPHSRAGSVQTLGMPIKFSEAEAGPVTGAPLLGEHTREVLKEHGFSEAEVEGFIADSAVVSQ